MQAASLKVSFAHLQSPLATVDDWFYVDLHFIRIAHSTPHGWIFLAKGQHCHSNWSKRCGLKSAHFFRRLRYEWQVEINLKPNSLSRQWCQVFKLTACVTVRKQIKCGQNNTCSSSQGHEDLKIDTFYPFTTLALCLTSPFRNLLNVSY